MEEKIIPSKKSLGLFYNPGDKITTGFGLVGLISQVGGTKYCVVSVDDGNRYTEPKNIKTEDNGYLTYKNVRMLCGNEDFKVVKRGLYRQVCG